MPDLVPSVPEDPAEFSQYYEMAREIVRRVRHREHLSDDEIIVLSVVASQITLARYLEPHREDRPDAVLDQILDILDRSEVVQAISSKMLWLLNNRPKARLDAPSGKLVDQLGSLADPDEPTGG